MAGIVAGITIDQTNNQESSCGCVSCAGPRVSRLAANDPPPSSELSVSSSMRSLFMGRAVWRPPLLGNSHTRHLPCVVRSRPPPRHPACPIGHQDDPLAWGMWDVPHRHSAPLCGSGHQLYTGDRQRFYFREGSYACRRHVDLTNYFLRASNTATTTMDIRS